MRKRERKLVITFHTTTEAMAMEKACQEREIPGRLIPVPRQISAGCGLSWCMPAEWAGDIGGFMEEKGLHCESVGEYMI